jgi:hypothetical protein
MGIGDVISRVTGIGGEPPQPPIFAQGNPEFAPMYGAWEQEDMTGVTGIALDNSSLIMQIESFLSGRQVMERTDPKTGKTKAEWQNVAEPKMNEKGIRAIILEVRARLDKNTIMTFFPNIDMLKEFMLNFSTNFIVFLGQNMENFEIRSEYASSIAWFIIDNVYVTLLRGLEGNEKQGVYKQSKRIEHFQNPMNSPSMMQAQRQGVFK